MTFNCENVYRKCCEASLSVSGTVRTDSVTVGNRSPVNVTVRVYRTVCVVINRSCSRFSLTWRLFPRSTGFSPEALKPSNRPAEPASDGSVTGHQPVSDGSPAGFTSGSGTGSGVRVAVAASWWRSRLMESDCRIPVACCRPRVLILHALFWGLVSLRVFGAALLSEEKTAVLKQVAAPCWLLEDFVVTAECSQCNAFQTRSWLSCGTTGYVERVNCTRSNKDEYKSCRSAVMEEHLFWKFEAAMLALTAVFAVLVVVRQRWLDRLASEKVRRQIESI